VATKPVILSGDSRVFFLPSRSESQSKDLSSGFSSFTVAQKYFLSSINLQKFENAFVIVGGSTGKISSVARV